MDVISPEVGAATPTATVPRKRGRPRKAVSATSVDVIKETAHKIENMEQDEALALGRQLRDDGDYNAFQIGGVLSLVSANDWWKPQYSSFQEYVQAEFPTLSETGSPYRKARYLVNIYDALVESDVPWEKVEVLGWTKLTIIAPLLTQENVDEWVTKGRQMTVLQLKEYRKQLDKDAEEEGEGGEESEGGVPQVSSITFRVHPDQKTSIRAAIEKAKQHYETESDAVALDYLAVEFMSGSLGKQKVVPLTDQLKSAGQDQAIAALNEAFPGLISMEEEDGDSPPFADGDEEAVIGATTG